MGISYINVDRSKDEKNGGLERGKKGELGRNKNEDKRNSSSTVMQIGSSTIEWPMFLPQVYILGWREMEWPDSAETDRWEQGRV